MESGSPGSSDPGRWVRATTVVQGSDEGSDVVEATVLDVIENHLVQAVR